MRRLSGDPNWNPLAVPRRHMSEATPLSAPAPLPRAQSEWLFLVKPERLFLVKPEQEVDIKRDFLDRL